MSTTIWTLVRWISLTLSGDKLLLENQDGLGYRLVASMERNLTYSHNR